jgi:hypothetical protein
VLSVPVRLPCPPVTITSRFAVTLRRYYAHDRLTGPQPDGTTGVMPYGYRLAGLNFEGIGMAWFAKHRRQRHWQFLLRPCRIALSEARPLGPVHGAGLNSAFGPLYAEVLATADRRCLPSPGRPGKTH